MRSESLFITFLPVVSIAYWSWHFLALWFSILCDVLLFVRFFVFIFNKWDYKCRYVSVLSSFLKSPNFWFPFRCFTVFSCWVAKDLFSTFPIYQQSMNTVFQLTVLCTLLKTFPVNTIALFSFVVNWLIRCTVDMLSDVCLIRVIK